MTAGTIFYRTLILTILLFDTITLAGMKPSLWQVILVAVMLMIIVLILEEGEE